MSEPLTPLHAEVGKMIRDIRQARGWSQADLAAAIDTNPGYISQVEHGAKNLRVATLARILAALGVRLIIRLEAESEHEH